MCDIIGMLSTVIHQTQNDYHPIEHDNDLADLFPNEKKKIIYIEHILIKNINKNIT